MRIEDVSRVIGLEECYFHLIIIFIEQVKTKPHVGTLMDRYDSNKWLNITAKARRL